ncbi:zingipain-1-like isoform X1 [Papaver somniferum]|uniref:zingipain-1-like isoform X1 n=1 Tax=Papaver somniferum TaxID=3469 RepID=UPI000E6FD2B1|nr:zingipain-1-like isoform X1 [Papaver somniferum]
MKLSQVIHTNGRATNNAFLKSFHTRSFDEGRLVRDKQILRPQKAILRPEFADCQVKPFTTGSILGENTELPRRFDWREKLPVLPQILEQEYFKTCWCHSVCTVLEYAHIIRYGKHVALSAQQLIDYFYHFVNNDGQNTFWAMEFVRKFGIARAVDYPYVGYHCEPKKFKPYVRFEDIRTWTEDEEKAIAKDHTPLQRELQHGPIIVGLPGDADDADDGYRLKEYHGGLYTGPLRYTSGHVGVGVGYDFAKDIPRWIVQNSWGSKWGENGFVNVAHQGPKHSFLYLRPDEVHAEVTLLASEEDASMLAKP